MPIVAESGPLIFGETGSSPSPTIAPTPYIPPSTPRPPQISPSSNFVEKHIQFIQQIESLNSCFKSNQITNFTNNETKEHIQVAMIDKYLVKHEDMYCSKQGVKILSDKLKRFID